MDTACFSLVIIRPETVIRLSEFPAAMYIKSQTRDAQTAVTI